MHDPIPSPRGLQPAVEGDSAKRLEERQTEWHRSVRACWNLPRDRALPTLYKIHADLAAIDEASLAAPGALALRLLARSIRILDGERSVAADALARAETWARSHGDRAQQALLLAERGSGWGDEVGLGHGLHHFADALALCRDLPDQKIVCLIWNDLGKRLVDAGLHGEATQCFQMSLHHAGDLCGEAWDQIRLVAHGNLAWAAHLGGEHETALRHADRCLAGFAAAGPSTDPRAVSAVCETRAGALLGLHRTEAALVSAQEARQWAGASQSLYNLCGADLVFGRALVACGRREEGFDLLQQTVQRCRRQMPKQLVNALWTTAWVFRDAGESQAAQMYLHELATLKATMQAGLVAALQTDAARRVADTARSNHLQILTISRERPDELRFDPASREALSNLNQLLEEHAVAAERLDDTTGAHCYRVGRLAALLGERIGLGDDVCFLLDLAARLHDVGKLMVPEDILMQRTRLSPEERRIMEHHTIAGWEILARTRMPQMHIAQEIARHHHEWWNGQGYPDKLVGSAIPISARVSALVDVFDALTHARPYKAAWPIDEAMAEIVRLRGVQFDPDITDVFVELIAALRAQHDDLDALLEVDARRSHFVEARDEVSRLFILPAGPGHIGRPMAG